MCVDACFTQKHNKSQRDPAKVYTDSVFIDEEELQRMEEIVESIRPPRTTGKKATGSAQGAEEEDRCEKSLKVPNSALDGCESSFKAADERRQKASTKFFDCTGIMALMCRHDRVLWLANMTSAGEKQFYALALINKLFRNLPPDFRIGCLYDIGCQTHRSCVKWGFLSEFLPRLRFAISVFHAFGHCWACQLVYHPRKCEGFGLSDGEGCERFWHSISRLIPHLRVCGVGVLSILSIYPVLTNQQYYQRLYTLDRQVEYLSDANLRNLADWIVGKTCNAYGRAYEGHEAVTQSGHDWDYLRAQWKQQVDTQTAPLKSKPIKCLRNTFNKTWL